MTRAEQIFFVVLFLSYILELYYRLGQIVFPATVNWVRSKRFTTTYLFPKYKLIGIIHNILKFYCFFLFSNSYSCLRLVPDSSVFLRKNRIRIFNSVFHIGIHAFIQLFKTNTI